MRRLEIDHLRNLAAVRLQLGSHFNCLVGPNGAGKTSVLEAAYLLTRGRSFRGHAVSPVVADGQDGLVVRAELDTGRSLGVARSRRGKSVLHIDQQPTRRLSEAAALLPLNLLLPDVSELVFGAPGERRRYLDGGLFHVEPAYLMALKDFQGANRQRNALLRTWGDRDSGQQMDVWTEAFCRHAERVDGFRTDYVEELRPWVAALLQELAVPFEVELTYRNGWGEESLDKLLGATLAKDVKSGMTGAGPHRAELSLGVAGTSARNKLSRGQGKLLATALIVAQARLLQAQTQRRSLFLIDELGAEMDSAHLARLVAVLDSATCQVIATSTRLPGEEFGNLASDGGLTLFHVEQGQVRSSQVEPRSIYG
ncbi:MAG: DNA replication and repair protein RecF [Gammaproteobacteria bacterium]|nr:DNA replication and repair protein RecF [Gammaproteobacteria bacterium]